MKNWKKKFKLLVKEQQNNGNPYFPNWDNVESFINDLLEYNNKRYNKIYDKIEVIGNLIEQIMLMNSIGDQVNFVEAYKKASKLCFDAARQMEDFGLNS